MTYQFDYSKITQDNEPFDLQLSPDQSPETTKASPHIWHHRRRDDPELPNWLHDTLDLDPYVVDTLTNTLSRPQCHIIGEGILLVLHGVNIDPAADLEDMVSMRIWVNAQQIVTVTQRPLASLSMALSATDIKNCSPIEVAVRLVEKITSLFKESVIDLESKFLELDDALYNAQTSKRANQLKDNASQIIWFKRFAFPQSHALEDLVIGAPTKLIHKKRRARIKQCSSITLRLAENLNALQEHVLLLQDHLDNQSEERRRKHTYLFTLISGVFLPLNLFAGMLGANVGGMPLVGSSWGFTIICLIAISMGAAFAFAIRRLL